MKNYNKTISVFNGNNKRYTLKVPTILIDTFGNDVAKKHFERNTGLKLEKYFGRLKATPKTFKQLYKIFATYNFKTTFYDNATYENTLMLEFNRN